MWKTLICPALIVVGLVWLTTSASQTASMGKTEVVDPVASATTASPSSSQDEVVKSVNRELERLREAANVQAAAVADEYTIFRRLSLALHGTIPSLEEIRAFENDRLPGRLSRQLNRMLIDSRYSSYFAERLGRSYVGVENGQFLIFRRDRFMDWLTRQLEQNRPYNEIVRDMVSGTGVWTGDGEVNFVTSAFADGEFDPNKLTARSVRAFLGQRVDCAQCHDHPFDHWKQDEFHGLSAHFGQVKLSLAGVVDDKKREHKYEEAGSLEEVEIAPAVPFNPEWLGESGSRRERLAAWMTHPENKRFERATANRVWALMFGIPFISHRPVDDLPDPGTDPDTAVLDILGADFREHNYDLRRLIRVIAESDAFRRSSIYPFDGTDSESEFEAGDSDQPDELVQRAKECWSVFPLVRLRPEQLIGSMIQANNIRTVNQDSHLFIRFLRLVRENDFVDEFGDPGVEELQEQSGTIPQALLRMNGDLARELTTLNPFFAPGRISSTASTPEKKVESSYLTCLTRYPTDEERNYFVAEFKSNDAGQVLEDLYWVLFNSPEFSWNH